MATGATSSSMPSVPLTSAPTSPLRASATALSAAAVDTSAVSRTGKRDTSRLDCAAMSRMRASGPTSTGSRNPANALARASCSELPSQGYTKAARNGGSARARCTSFWTWGRFCMRPAWRAARGLSIGCRWKASAGAHPVVPLRPCPAQSFPARREVDEIPDRDDAGRASSRIRRRPGGWPRDTAAQAPRNGPVAPRACRGCCAGCRRSCRHARARR